MVLISRGVYRVGETAKQLRPNKFVLQAIFLAFAVCVKFNLSIVLTTIFIYRSPPFPPQLCISSQNGCKD